MGDWIFFQMFIIIPWIDELFCRFRRVFQPATATFFFFDTKSSIDEMLVIDSNMKVRMHIKLGMINSIHLIQFISTKERYMTHCIR